MRDPFSEPANKQLYREAQIGLTVLSCLLLLFCYLAIKRFSGDFGELPAAVRNAPLARIVQPDGSPQGYSEFRDPNPERFDPANDLEIVGAPRAIPMADRRQNMARRDTDSGTSVRLAAAELAVSPPQPDGLGEPVIKIPDIELPAVPQFPERERELHVDFQPEEPPTVETHVELRAQSPDKATITVTEQNELPEGEQSGDRGTDFPIDAPSFEQAISNVALAEAKQEPGTEFSPLAESDNKNKNDFALDQTDQPENFAPADRNPSPSEFPQSDRSASDFSQAVEANIESKPRMASPHPIIQSREPELVSVVTPPSNEFSADEPSKQAIVPPKRLPNQIAVEDTNRYTTTEQDSFYTIAQQFYDDGRFFKALYEFNRQQHQVPFDLQPGMTLEIPSLQVLKAQFPDRLPRQKRDDSTDAENRVYLTGNDDTLFGIARDQLGQASRFVELIRMNERRLPENVQADTSLPAGMKLVLPPTD